MFEAIMNSLSTYYGLDWMTLILGQCGCLMITNKNRFGFVLSTLSCICGFTIAILSSQYGFVVHNAVLIFIMMRGFMKWKEEEDRLKENHNLVAEPAQ